MFVTPFQAGCRCLKLQLEGGIEEEEKEKDRKMAACDRRIRSDRDRVTDKALTTYFLQAQKILPINYARLFFNQSESTLGLTYRPIHLTDLISSPFFRSKKREL